MDWKDVESWKSRISEGSAIAIIWDVDDVFAQDGGENDLTNDEAEEILNLLRKCHDAETGINWDIIQFHIDEVVRRRK